MPELSQRRGPFRLRRKLIAMISDGGVVRKPLDHLGLPSEPPVPARSRVGEDLAFLA
jgi:hypothetical protein